MDWITGEKFFTITDFVYTPKEVTKDDYYVLPNTLDLGKLKDKNIVYTHTMYVKRLFEVISDVKNEFIVISHNCDVNVDASFRLPENVVRWHTTNVNVVDERVQSIPIGLENERWYSSLHKKEMMLKISRKPKHFRNLLYINHNVKTNRNKRQPVYSLERNSWVTAERGVNGRDFNNYISNVYNHKYMICPIGNGMDTHRFWECLYMGTVPIVVRDINNWFYNDLPILYVNNWGKITEELLNDMWSNFEGGVWDRNKLTFEYWKDVCKQ
jgi:hypothetical protein